MVFNNQCPSKSELHILFPRLLLFQKDELNELLELYSHFSNKKRHNLKA